jgi:sulfonate transport system ATP-binding protein
MLEISGLTKRFPGGTLALQGVDLTADAGEIVAIIGGSGCGKSTLLRLIAGLDEPTDGSVSLDGERVDGPHPKVGFVFQEPRLMPWLNVTDNIGFGLGHFPRADRKALVEDALHAVRLHPFAKALPRQLSGGMAQRVALARALVARPEVLLMDEPFSALDALTREVQQDQLIMAWAERRPILLLVTHDVDEALALGNRVVVMRSHGGGIERIFHVPLERPRRRTGEAFQRLKERVLEALHAGMGYAVPSVDATAPAEIRRRQVA